MCWKMPAVLNFVAIPGGMFKMGSDAEQVDACIAYWGARLVDPSYDVGRFRQWVLKEFPQHTVRVASFRISRFPVTNDEYRVFVKQTGQPLPESLVNNEPGTHPVWGVSFEEAIAYCD